MDKLALDSINFDGNLPEKKKSPNYIYILFVLIFFLVIFEAVFLFFLNKQKNNQKSDQELPKDSSLPFEQNTSVEDVYKEFGMQDLYINDPTLVDFTKIEKILEYRDNLSEYVNFFKKFDLILVFDGVIENLRLEDEDENVRSVISLKKNEKLFSIAFSKDEIKNAEIVIIYDNFQRSGSIEDLQKGNHLTIKVEQNLLDSTLNDKLYLIVKR